MVQPLGSRIMKADLIFNQTQYRSFASIIEGCRERNSQAQNLLYKQFFGYAKSVCLRYSSSNEEAKEILNHGFLKVFNNIEKFDTELPFKAWLRTIMINTAINYYKKYKKNYSEIGFDVAGEPTYDDAIISNITAEEILLLVQKLSPVYRAVFVMYVVDGYNHKEIAEILEINEGTSRSNYLKARTRLQSLIQSEFPYLYENYSQKSEYVTK